MIEVFLENEKRIMSGNLRVEIFLKYLKMVDGHYQIFL